MFSVGDSATYEFVPKKVRPHLAAIVRQQQIENFPYDVHCYCQARLAVALWPVTRVTAGTMLPVYQTLYLAVNINIRL